MAGDRPLAISRILGMLALSPRLCWQAAYQIYLDADHQESLKNAGRSVRSGSPTGGSCGGADN